MRPWREYKIEMFPLMISKNKKEEGGNYLKIGLRQREFVSESNEFTVE